MSALSRNYRKGYEMLLEEYKEERRKKGLSNVGFPNTFMWVYLSFLAIGLSMALTIGDIEGQEELHVSRAVWITLGWLILMAVLIFIGVI